MTEQSQSGPPSSSVIWLYCYKGRECPASFGNAIWLLHYNHNNIIHNFCLIDEYRKLRELASHCHNSFSLKRLLLGERIGWMCGELWEEEMQQGRRGKFTNCNINFLLQHHSILQHCGTNLQVSAQYTTNWYTKLQAKKYGRTVRPASFAFVENYDEFLWDKMTVEHSKPQGSARHFQIPGFVQYKY